MNLSYCKSWHRGRGGTIWLEIRVGVQTNMGKRFPSLLGNSYMGHLPTDWVLTLFTAQDGKSFRECVVEKSQRAGRCSSISMRPKVQGLGPGPPQVSGTTTAFSIWLGSLSVSSKTHCSVPKTIATQSTHILNKIHATADKGGKKIKPQ